MYPQTGVTKMQKIITVGAIHEALPKYKNVYSECMILLKYILIFLTGKLLDNCYFLQEYHHSYDEYEGLI